MQFPNGSLLTDKFMSVQLVIAETAATENRNQCKTVKTNTGTVKTVSSISGIRVQPFYVNGIIREE